MVVAAWAFQCSKGWKYAFFGAVSPCTNSCIGRETWESNCVLGLRRNLSAWENCRRIRTSLTFTHRSHARRRVRIVGAKLPHGVDDVTVIWGDVERECNIYTPTGELHSRWPVDRLFFQRTDTEDVGEIPLRQYGPEFQRKRLHWLAV